jgi:hypothetical protein
MCLRTGTVVAVVAALVCAGAAGGPVVGMTARALDQDPRQAPQRASPMHGTERGAASVSGRVIAADSGRPVARARVVLSSATGGARSSTVRTDASGRFEIEGLTAGVYSISASKEGYVRTSVGTRAWTSDDASVTIAEGQRVEQLVFELVRGGVITGHILGEDGDPLPRIQVRAMRLHYTLGEPRLAVTESDRTDDRGEYCLFGLSPGRYYVAATMAADLVIGPVDRDEAAPDGGRVGYATTYYPTTTMLSQAAPIAVAAGGEVAGISFRALPVPLADVSGTVVSPESAARASVHLIPDGPGGRVPGQAVVSLDGTFRIRDVAPGEYLVVAREIGEGTGIGPHRPQRLFAVQSVGVAGQEVSGIVLVLGSGAKISGTTVFQSGRGRPPPQFGAVQITLLPLRATGFGSSVSAPRADGTFAVTDLPPVPVLLRATVANPRLQGTESGQWQLKEVWVSGRDVIDTPIQLVPNEELRDVTLVFGDRVTTLRGTLTDHRGAAVSFRPLVVFPADETLSRQPHSRRIRVVRTDNGGAFEVRGLPAGDYLVHALDRSNEHEWSDPDVLKTLRQHAVPAFLDEDQVASVQLRAGAPRP